MVKKLSKTREIKCPNCGGVVVVSSSGRKPYNIPVRFISDALQNSKDGGARVNYSKAAGILSKKLEIPISRGLVHWRVGVMASARGISRVEMVEILLKGEANGNV